MSDTKATYTTVNVSRFLRADLKPQNRPRGVDVPDRWSEEQLAAIANEKAKGVTIEGMRRHWHHRRHRSRPYIADLSPYYGSAYYFGSPFMTWPQRLHPCDPLINPNECPYGYLP
jgi:hypothetical protein